jgi:hypothetical protein
MKGAPLNTPPPPHYPHYPQGDHKAGEIQGQTRQHARLINLLGVRQLIIGVNKMDSDTAGYKQERYNEIRDEMRHMLARVGWKVRPPRGLGSLAQLRAAAGRECTTPGGKLAECAPVLSAHATRVPLHPTPPTPPQPDFIEKSVPVIPISGWMGDNLIKKSEKMAWWSGQEVKTLDDRTVKIETLLNALNDMVIVPERKVRPRPAAGNGCSAAAAACGPLTLVAVNPLLQHTSCTLADVPHSDHPTCALPLLRRPTPPCACPSPARTRSRAWVMCSPAAWSRASSSPVMRSSSCPPTPPPTPASARCSPWRCTTSVWTRPAPATTWA